MPPNEIAAKNFITGCSNRRVRSAKRHRKFDGAARPMSSDHANQLILVPSDLATARGVVQEWMRERTP